MNFDLKFTNLFDKTCKGEINTFIDPRPCSFGEADLFCSELSLLAYDINCHFLGKGRQYVFKTFDYRSNYLNILSARFKEILSGFGEDGDIFIEHTGYTLIFGVRLNGYIFLSLSGTNLCLLYDVILNMELITKQDDKLLFHKGYLNEAYVVLDKIKPFFLHNYKGIVITWHSLGGAVGTIFSYLIEKDSKYSPKASVGSYMKPFCVYTFGSPKYSSEDISSNTRQVRSFERYCDIIPRLPHLRLRNHNTHSLPRSIHLNRHKFGFTTNIFDRFTSHSMCIYNKIISVMNCASSHKKIDYLREDQNLWWWQCRS